MVERVESGLPSEEDMNKSYLVHVGDLLGHLQVTNKGDIQYKPASKAVRTMCTPALGATTVTIKNEDVIGVHTVEGNSLQVWHCPVSYRDAERVKRKLVKSPTFTCESAADVRAISALIRRVACWCPRGEPARITVVINPASGRGNANAVWEKTVQPMFAAAGFHATSHVTTAPGHATDVARAVTSAVDGLVFLGGDGTVFEGIQGLFQRPDWEAMCGTPVGQIPVGSGNGLAASTGCWDAVTAVHAVVKGGNAPMDGASMLQPGSRTRLYAFLSLQYSLMSNLDIGTEHLRWMGGMRFTYGAVREIMTSSAHTAKVSYLPAAVASDAQNTACRTAPEGLRPGDRLAAACCPEDSPEVSSMGPPTPLLDALGPVPSAVPAAGGRALPEGWKELGSEPLQLFSLSNLPWASLDAKLSPKSTLSSGSWQLIYTHRLGRMEGLKILTACEKGEHLGLPGVMHEDVAALAIEPISDSTWLTVDGEEIPFKPIFMEVHPGLLRAFLAPSFWDAHGLGGIKG